MFAFVVCYRFCWLAYGAWLVLFGLRGFCLWVGVLLFVVCCFLVVVFGVLVWFGLVSLVCCDGVVFDFICLFMLIFVVY